MSDINAPKVRQTMNYDQFGFFESNRGVDHWPVISKSMEEKDLGKYTPILVDSKYRIIDGQGRFFARRHLGKPIYYIVAAEATEEDIIRLNTGQKNWTLADYFNYHCSHKKEHYVRLKNVMESLGCFTLPEMITHFASTSGTKKGNRLHAACRQGGLLFPPERINIVNAAKNLLMAYEKGVPKSKRKNRRSLVAALASVVKNFSDIQGMADKLERHGLYMEPQVDITAYLAELEKIYNRNRQGKRIRFDWNL